MLSVEFLFIVRLLMKARFYSKAGLTLNAGFSLHSNRNRTIRLYFLRNLSKAFLKPVFMLSVIPQRLVHNLTEPVDEALSTFVSLTTLKVFFNGLKRVTAVSLAGSINALQFNNNRRLQLCDVLVDIFKQMNQLLGSY
jgi:hypothetical protein